MLSIQYFFVYRKYVPYSIKFHIMIKCMKIHHKRGKIMDKYVELLCKQNPKMTLECNNPDCKQKTTVNSKDVF